VRPRALLDANVLLPPQQRNLLLQIAFTEVIDVFWTDLIIDEWLQNIGVAEDRTKCETKTVPLMRKWFPGSCLPPAGDDPVGSTHAGDRHVARSALGVAPCALLTWNVKHFDEEKLARLEIEVVTPDAFLCRLYDANPSLIMDITRDAMANLTRSAPTWDEYLAVLNRNGLKDFVERLLSWDRKHQPDD
jgi:hypothetical protein